MKFPRTSRSAALDGASRLCEALLLQEFAKSVVMIHTHLRNPDDTSSSIRTDESVRMTEIEAGAPLRYDGLLTDLYILQIIGEHDFYFVDHQRMYNDRGAQSKRCFMNPLDRNLR